MWRGVPFAAPPIGASRFRPPRPPDPWDGARSATAFGPSSISTEVPGLILPSGDDARPESEDCLYLNVWSPLSGQSARPVLVWIHGGAFVFGSGSNYDGAWLAEHGDVVIVTINYRLGPWGFLDLATIGGPTFEGAVNVGLLDQVAALQWVKSNISAFGGDAGRVTVIGQASGATCIGALLAMPAAAGLFQRAILQSGAADRVQHRWRSRAVALRLLDTLGVDCRETSRLQDLPVDTLRRAAGRVVQQSADPELEGEPFLPVVDGTVLPRHPLAGLIAGSASNVPLLLSVCQQEANLFLTISEGYVEAKEQHARAWFGDVAWERLIEMYQVSHVDQETGSNGVAPGLAAAKGRSDLLTALMFGIPAIRTAEAHHQAGGEVWLMRFDHTPGQPPLDQLGPCHGADLPFTWMDFTDPDDEAFPGLATAEDREVAKTWQDAILAFARAGDPGTEDLPDWPSYRPDRRAVMSISPDSSLEVDPFAEQRRAWQGLPLPQTLNLRRASRSTVRRDTAQPPTG